MATNELFPFANGENANVMPTNQWQALTDILENGFKSGIARSEQVNRVLAQGAVASYVLGQLIVDQLNKDATLDKDTLYQNIVKALQENAKDACLPLSGGTMTAPISTNQKVAFKKIDASGQMQVFGGTSYTDGAHINLNGKDYANGKGEFSLVATDGANKKYFSGSPNGTLKWNNNNVLTSANGLALDGSNKMSGKLGFTTSNHVFINQPNGYLRLWGGNVDDGIMGGNITLFGGKHETGWGTGAGGIIIEANNGSTRNTLELSTDGSLLWAEHSVYQYLNSSVKTQLATDGSVVTVPYDGLLSVKTKRSSTDSGYVEIFLDGASIGSVDTNNYSTGHREFPVMKGQTIKVVRHSVTEASSLLIGYK